MGGRAVPVRAAMPQCAEPQRWKDAPLARELFVLHNLMMRVADRLVADLGLTASRWQLLGALETYSEPPSLTQLTSDGLLTLQNVSRMVAAMEADGLVERFQKPGGGRTVFVRLTPAGAKVRDAACDRGKRFCTAFLEGMRKQDVPVMERWIDRMVRNMERLEWTLEGEAKNRAPSRSRRAQNRKVKA